MQGRHHEHVVDPMEYGVVRSAAAAAAAAAAASHPFIQVCCKGLRCSGRQLPRQHRLWPELLRQHQVHSNIAFAFVSFLRP